MASRDIYEPTFDEDVLQTDRISCLGDEESETTAGKKPYSTAYKRITEGVR